MEKAMLKGSCLCGAVQFQLTGELRPPLACHCTQCRKSSGHFWAATEVARNKLTITKDEGLAWYRSSEQARRGFCRLCGSSLFWEMIGEDSVSVGVGTIDGSTGLAIAEHIFVADKGDYYQIADGLPQLEKW
jgi:hypothetical protein